MHTLKKTFLTLALALAFVSAEAAQNTGRILIPESKLKFKANDDYTEVTITGCTLTWNDYKSVDRKWIEIPSKIQGIPVTEIGEGAFEGAGQYSYDDNNNVGLWIPDGIKKLGRAAFHSSHFISIRLPEGLKEIPGKGHYKGNYYDGCFEYCRAKSINIPSTVEYIGESAFNECRLEEAVIPAGCKISTSAFARSNIKKLTFPKGRIYFEIHSENNHYGNMQDYEYCVPFKDCKNLETIVIPKELDIVYSASPTYLTEKLTLSDFITGDKINASFALQKQLKAVNVRNKYKVEGEEALVLYNKAVSEKKWDQAKSIAQNAYNLFESFDYSGSAYYKEYNEWKERISDVNCILYDKAVSEKNWNQAKSIAQNTYNLFWNNNAEKEYEWEERITDVMCAQYFPALASKILKLDGAFVKKDGVLIYKIELTDDIYGYQGFILKDDSGEKVGDMGYTVFDDFILKDDSGKKVCTVSMNKFTELFKQKTGVEYKFGYEYHDNNRTYYIYRNATEAELTAYNKNRKDAVKTFFDTITPNGSIVKSGNNLTFKINLPKDSYKYYSERGYYDDYCFDFHAKDAEGKNQEFTESEFLGFVKEITGLEYEVSDRSSNPYIYRKATEAELTAYNKNRKDAVKTFINSITPTGSVVQAGGSICFDITFPEGSYKNGTIYVNDASGKKQEFKESEFLKLVKEITGFDYNIYYYSSTYVYFIRRNATEAETAAYNQNRKDAVKTFIEKLTQSGNLVKDGSNFSFRIDFPKEAYTPDYGGTFYVKDAAGKKESFGKTEFLNLVKEITGFDYTLARYTSGGGAYYIYRDATKEEIADNEKFAMKTFLQKAEADGKLVKDGKKDIFMIQLASGTYESSQKVLYMTDVTGKELGINAKDFLTFAKETYGMKYTLCRNNNDGTYFLWREPTKDEKLLIAFNEGTLHTNLAAIKFEDKKGVITIKGFTEKKTAFENAGLKAKDVVKKITLKTEDGEEKEIGIADLLTIYPVPVKTVTFTIERTEKKNVQTLTVSAEVEWNEKELKKIK